VSTRIAGSLVLVAAALLSACTDAKPPIDAGPMIDSNIDSGSSCGGTVAFLQACTMNEMCESCLCQNFGHSMVCTKTCMGPADCPAPSSGCTAGVCRP
jgi:hypothetical protein